MSAASRYFVKASFIVIVLQMLSGCFVIHGTSKEWRNDDRAQYYTGPGVGEATFLAREKNLYEIDDGSRLSIGIAPGIPILANKGNWISATVGWCVVAPLVNCIYGLPTIQSLFIAPFDKSTRTGENNARPEWGILGCCEWTETAKTELIEHGAREDIVEIHGVPGLEGARIAGKTQDGVRLLFEYPGNPTMLAELKQHEKVAVAFKDTDNKYRLFSPARPFKDSYTFKDIGLSDESSEIAQIRYYNKVQLIKSSLAHLPAHKEVGVKAKTVVTAADSLLAALPNMDRAVLVRLEKDAESVNAEAKEIAEAEKRAAKARELAIAHRKAAEQGWRNEDALRSFALRESPAIWQTVQQLRTEVAERRKAIAQLRTDLQEFGTNPDSDPDYLKFGQDVDTMLDSLSGIFLNLEKAYIAAKKFEATPGRNDYEATMRAALEGGIKEAENATRRFKEMRSKK